MDLDTDAELAKTVGYNYLAGNELTMMERQANKLRWERPIFDQSKGQDYEPVRMSYEMLRNRSEEMLGYGRRRMKDQRKIKFEFPERIKEMKERERREEEERNAGGGPKQRVRWWHRKTAVELRDPLKMLRFNNLTFRPEELMNAKDIVFLQLTGCKLGDEGMSWISAFVQQSYTLKRLCLQANKITEAGCQELFLGLRTTKTLMELDVSMNPIGDDGVAVLCNALSENARWSKVYCLNVSCCKLGPGAAFHLARLIRDFKPLQSLLAWRNNMGTLTPMKVGGVASIFEELRSSNLKLLNLSANVIMDSDLAAHANSREVERRRRSQLEMDKKRQQVRVEELQRKIREKRRGAVWDDQRVELASLEKELEQERSRLRVSISLEQKSRTGAQRTELEFQKRVHNATGTDLVPQSVRPRLVLKANHSIRRVTLVRLSQFYDLDVDPDVEAFIARQRRYDKIVASRRQVGEPYEGPRDVEQYDDFNVFPTYPFNPDQDHARRTTMAQWREEKRIEALNAVAVKFEKFSFKGPKEPPSKNAKLVSAGFKVASGVNDNIRDEKAGDRLRKKEEDVKVRREEATNVKVKTKVITEVEAGDVEVVRVKADGSKSVSKVAGDGKALTLHSQEEADVTEPEARKMEQRAADSFRKRTTTTSTSSVASSSDAGSDSELPPPRRVASTAREPTEEEDNNDDLEGFDFDGDGDLGDEDGVDLMAAMLNTAIDEPTAVQQKMETRMAEHKAKLETKKVKVTPRDAVEPSRLVVVGLSSSDALEGSLGGSTTLQSSASVTASPANAQRSLTDLPTELPAPAAIPAIPALATSNTSPETTFFMEMIKTIAQRQDTIRELSEKGSPSDADLAKLEKEKEALADFKLQSVGKLNAFQTAAVLGPTQLDEGWDFIDGLIKETDLPRGNIELLSAIFAKVATDYPTLLEDRGLPAIAACDSSIAYLKMMLAVPNARFDVVDLVSSCFFNQTARIPLALLVLQQPPSTINLESAAEELGFMWQEFFEDVASSKRAIPKENRQGRLDLLTTMLSFPYLPVDLEAESGDGQSVLFRAAAEGDADLMKVLLQSSAINNVADINAAHSAGMTLLHAAVVGNNLAVVKQLDAKFGSTIDFHKSSENGNAMDLATSLGREKGIQEWLTAKGVKKTGKAPTKAKGKKSAPKVGGKKAPPKRSR